MSSMIPSLAVVLAVLAFERSRLLMLLYLMLAVVAGGWDGLAAGLTYWVLFGLLRLVLDLFGLPALVADSSDI